MARIRGAGALQVLALALAACSEPPPPEEPARLAELTTILREVMQKGTKADSPEGAVFTLDVTLEDFFNTGPGTARITLRDSEPFAQSPDDVAAPDVLSIAVENRKGRVVVSLEDRGADGFNGEDTSAIYARLEKFTRENEFDTFIAQTDQGRGGFFYAGVIGTVAAALEGKPLPTFAPVEDGTPGAEPGGEPLSPEGAPSQEAPPEPEPAGEAAPPAPGTP